MAFDFGDIASRYASARMDQAMQPFNDPEAYLNQRMQQDLGVDTTGNVKPKSTTINYNDDGTQTVTTKHEVAPTAGPDINQLAQSSPTVTNDQFAPFTPVSGPQPMQMPQPAPQAAPVAQAPVAPVAPQMPTAAPQAQTAPMPQTGPMSQPTAGAGPVNPAAAPVVQLPQLPQPGPGVQVAGPAAMPPAAPAAQAAPAATPAPQAAPLSLPTATAEGMLKSWTDDIAKIQGNVTELGKYIANEANPEEGRAFAGRVIGKMYKEKEMQDKAQRKAMEAVQTGDLLPLVKETKKNTEEASYIKAYLFARLGLNELAKEEQIKLGAGATYQAVTGPNNEKAIVQYSANGLPMKGFDASGKQLSEEKLSSITANALPSKAHLLPSAHGTPVVNAQGVMGQMMYDPQTQSTYVQVGDKRMNTAGWTTMAQNVSNVYGAAGAKQQGTQAAQGFTNQPMPAMPGAAPQAAQAPAYPAATPTATPAALLHQLLLLHLLHCQQLAELLLLLGQLTQLHQLLLFVLLHKLVAQALVALLLLLLVVQFTCNNKLLQFRRLLLKLKSNVRRNWLSLNRNHQQKLEVRTLPRMSTTKTLLTKLMT